MVAAVEMVEAGTAGGVVEDEAGRVVVLLGRG